MKYHLIILITLVTSACAYAEGVQEEIIGNVVAVKRNFGHANFEACKQTVKTYGSDSFQCVVTFPNSSQFVHGALRYTYRKVTVDSCSVEIASVVNGYSIAVEPIVHTPHSIAPLTQTVALECIQKAIATTELGKTDIQIVVLDVR